VSGIGSEPRLAELGWTAPGAPQGTAQQNCLPSTMRDSGTATLSLVYLARLREAFGAASERLDVPPGVTTVGTLRAWLAARGDPWATELAPGRAVRIAVNHDLADADALVRPGDEVAFFPPVTGG
jgi:molybdopterin synthase sulfur carrier subunit